MSPPIVRLKPNPQLKELLVAMEGNGERAGRLKLNPQGEACSV